MDRLICGDVGFGKTEVAIRAAFLTVMTGRQAALIVPTTLLARQHYKNFAERFKGLPVKVAQASRLVGAKAMRETREGLKSGEVDLVIGTHALLSKSVEFRDLALLIVDEEQKFGVKHKEQLKALKSDVHVLPLSATPIPRTLQLALTGVRELSMIATAPVDRTIGIEVGADDYMAKPFDARELLARVKRQASRMARFRDTPEPAETGEILPNQPLGEWTVDFARRRVTSNDGRQARLSDAEFRALEALLIQRGTIVSRDDIHEAVVGHRDRDPLDRRVDVLISCIRRKLKLNELSNIRTVHRVGYIID